MTATKSVVPSAARVSSSASSISAGGSSWAGAAKPAGRQLAEEVALALCTIGGSLERQVSTYRREGDELRAILLDGIGTTAVGELAEKAHELINEVASERGWQASAPISPGNLDWPVEEQRLFFDLLPGKEIGVQLNESYLMVPLKSVSWAVALGRNLHPAAQAPPCDYCSLAKKCRYRQKSEPLPE